MDTCSKLIKKFLKPENDFCRILLIQISDWNMDGKRQSLQSTVSVRKNTSMATAKIGLERTTVGLARKHREFGKEIRARVKGSSILLLAEGREIEMHNWYKLLVNYLVPDGNIRPFFVCVTFQKSRKGTNSHPNWWILSGVWNKRDL